MHRLLDEPIQLDFLDKKKFRKKIKNRKKNIHGLNDERDDLRRKIAMAKNSPRSQDIIDAEVKILKKSKRKLDKDIKKQKNKMKKTKKKLRGFGERYDISSHVQQIVNVDGMFRTEDVRFITNGCFDTCVATVGKMLNFQKPNYRKIASLVETIIGNLSLCYVDARSIDYKTIEILSEYILRHKPILDVINPFAVVVYNKFLLLARIGSASIIYDCDNITKSNKFSNSYKRYIEGKYAFDQFVDIAHFQQRYMTSEQMVIFSQYQRIIRVLEDGDYIDCKSNKLKQRIRNGLRDAGIRKQQIGQLVHYAYDRSMDAARDYYEKKDKRYGQLFDYLGSASKFSPDYAGDLYAMQGF
jgi:hypothetical protein